MIKTSLRMRPDRIIVGEVRGGEAVDLIGSALNCGHDGSMSTGHANSARDMLMRLETMMLMGVCLLYTSCRLLGSLEMECKNQGFSMVLRCSYGNIEEETRAIDELLQIGVEGIIIMCAVSYTHLLF